MNTYHDKFLSYDLYDSILSSTPPRSQFYHLQPLGLNTLYTESLTSYVTRLSQAHCLTITDFLEQAILNFSIKKPKSIKNYSVVLIFGSGHGINGSGELANQWIDIIEQITMISDLQSLTMARWKNVIADQGLLRRRRAWCPNCYEMWHQNNQPLYDLLIWSIKEIILCPYHKQYLRTQCQYCLYKPPIFLRYGNIGYCPKCNKFLGTSESLPDNKSIVVDEYQIQQQLLIAENIGELIAAAPKLNSQLDSNIFNSNMSRYFEHTTGSNKKRAVLHLQLPRTTTLNLINHKKVPKITTLLKISQKLKVTLLSLLTINSQIEHLESLTKSKIGTPEQSQKNKRLVILEQLRCPLEEQLESDEQPPPPLREVAERLDCSVHTLTEFYPEISRKIEANY